jgi:DNA-binding transcriptional LysR family regulator
MIPLPSIMMRSTPLLLEATPVGDRVYRLRFADGAAGEVDLAYLLEYGGVFEPLRDEEFFRALRADPEAGTIVWPNGADVAPETLYARLMGASTL